MACGAPVQNISTSNLSAGNATMAVDSNGTNTSLSADLNGTSLIPTAFQTSSTTAMITTTPVPPIGCCAMCERVPAAPPSSSNDTAPPPICVDPMVDPSNGPTTGGFNLTFTPGELSKQLMSVWRTKPGARCSSYHSCDAFRPWVERKHDRWSHAG
eukprot:2531161-Rhodomonas_salina.5